MRCRPSCRIGHDGPSRHRESGRRRADAAVFEAADGSAPDIAGRGVANPSALALAACMMLEYLGETDAAGRIRHALETTLRDGTILTPDLNGHASTTEFADALLRRLG